MTNSILRKIFLVPLLCSCSGLQTEKNPLNKEVDIPYHEKQLRNALYEVNDTSKIVYFTDAIDNIKCSLYIPTELEVVDSTDTPPESIIADVQGQGYVLNVNGRQVKLKKPIKDVLMMLPDNIGHTSKNKTDYLILKMGLVSFMGGDYRYSILLKLNADGDVIAQEGIETEGELTTSELTGHLNKL